MPPLTIRSRRVAGGAGHRRSMVNRAAGLLGSVRHPNALLAGLVIVPVLVAGLSFSSESQAGREQAAFWLAERAGALGFGVSAVTIEGLRDTREGDVLDYLAVTPSTPILGFDVDAARERVLALPWVREASVRRVFPGRLMVDIEEHDPFARLFKNERVLLVTVDGEEITDEITGSHARLPLVLGEGAPQRAAEIFSVLAERPAVLEEVVAMERVNTRRWSLHMRGGMVVHLPETNTAAALGRLERMMREHALLDRAIAAVDLRRESQLVVELTEAGLEALESEEGITSQVRGAS